MASVSGNNKIVLRGKYTDGGAEHEEGPLSGVCYPGMNLIMSAVPAVFGRHTYLAGSSDYVGTGTGITTSKAPLKILKEDSLRGKTVDDAYADGDNGFVHLASAGEVLQVLVASGELVYKGYALSAGTDGKFTVDATNAAVEVLEDSGGTLAADTLMRVRVL